MNIKDIFSALVGKWKYTRVITDKTLNKPIATVNGNAKFTCANSQSLLFYRETL